MALGARRARRARRGGELEHRGAGRRRQPRAARRPAVCSASPSGRAAGDSAVSVVPSSISPMATGRPTPPPSRSRWRARSPPPSTVQDSLGTVLDGAPDDRASPAGPVSLSWAGAATDPGTTVPTGPIAWSSRRPTPAGVSSSAQRSDLGRARRERADGTASRRVPTATVGRQRDVPLDAARTVARDAEDRVGERRRSRPCSTRICRWDRRARSGRLGRRASSARVTRCRARR